MLGEGVRAHGVLALHRPLRKLAHNFAHVSPPSMPPPLRSMPSALPPSLPRVQTARGDMRAATFLRILDLMDVADGAALQEMLEREMAPEDDFVRAVLQLLPSRKGK